MLGPKTLAAAASFAAIWLGSWTVIRALEYQFSLDPAPIVRPEPKPVAGRRLHWASVPVPARPEVTPAVQQAGASLYAKYCLECHGPEGQGDGPAARAFSPPPRNFSTGQFRLKTTPTDSLPQPADLYRSISTGFLATRMPGFGWLSPDDRWALVAQVISLTRVTNPDYEEPRPGEPPDPENWKYKARYDVTPPSASLDWPKAPPLDPGAPSRGHAIFLREGCDKCHGPEGRGDGPSANTITDATGALIQPMDYTRLLTHSKAGAAREDFFRVITTGLQSMPSFATVPEKDRWDLAAYVYSRAVPQEREVVASREAASLFHRHCSGCHGPGGRGDGPAAPFLAVEPRDLTSGVFKWKSTPTNELPSDEDIERILARGVPGTSMPSWALLAEPQRKLLVQFIKALAPRFRATGRVPRTPIAIPFAPRDLESPERIAKGRDLFGKWGCASCHGLSGHGDGPLAPILQDLWGYPVRPRDLIEAPLHAGGTPEDTYRVLTVGVEGTPMPSFAALTEEERYSLVAYVRDLRSRKGAER